MSQGSLFHLPGLGLGDVVQLSPGRRRDQAGRLFCRSTDPTRRRVDPSEEQHLVLLDAAPVEPLALWATWARLRGLAIVEGGRLVQAGAAA